MTTIRRGVHLKFFVHTMLAGVLLVPAAHVQSADYPDKPVRFVVPFTPGGSADIFARAIGQKLAEAWNQQVVIDNRGGSAGIIGSEVVAKSPPDGYTLMLGITANVAINPGLFPQLAYDPARDFAPVTLIAAAPYVMLVTPSLPARSVPEFIALAKARPRQLNYASTGSGSAGHLTAALFASMANVELTHVPYKNIGSILVDMFAGRIELMFVGLVSAQPHIKAQKLRAIAITGARRSPLMPELPTVAESGVKGFEVTGWYGVFVPAKTPAALVNRLNADIVRAMKQPDVNARFAAEGADLVGNTPAQFASFVKDEIERWSRVVKLAGARPD